jgi:hypothetical protein
MEWSSDGYVLAVGWQHGWAIFSVGGRCLAWGFGVEDSMDEERWRIIYHFNFDRFSLIFASTSRFQDSFMHGILDLVSEILIRLDKEIP